MALQGYIKLYRQIQENWLWQERRTFSKAEAWIDILLMVNHSDNKVPLGNELIPVKKGSRIISIRQLCEKWNWSNTKVITFLKMLQADGMITYKSDTKKTVLSVVNWDLYQCGNDTETSRKRHGNVTKTTRKHTNNNDKNENNDENDKEICTSIFETYTNNPELLQTLNDFLKMRKVIKKEMTERAIKSLLKKLDKFASTDEGKIAILEQSIISNWADIYELKESKSKKSSGLLPHERDLL